MSVDGVGGPDRLGAWRMFDLSAFPEMTEVGTRLINQSADTFARVTGSDNPLAPPDPFGILELTAFVPNDTGVPLDVASFGSEISYIANAPHIGLQAIVPNGMNTDLLAEQQVDGTLRGDPDPTFNFDRSFPIRAVDTLPGLTQFDSFVVAVSQEGSDNKLLLVDPQLNARQAVYQLPIEGRPLAVTALNEWPSVVDDGDVFSVSSLSCLAAGFPPSVCNVDVDEERENCLRRFPPDQCEDEEEGDPGDEGLLTPTEPRDLAVVMCESSGMCVVPIDSQTGEFQPSLLPQGVGVIQTDGGSPRGAVADRETQLLYVADGTAGLTIIDLARPGGRIDDDGDGIDDRVLISQTLPTNSVARAQQVALHRTCSGARLAAVAAGDAGVYVVKVGPADVEFVRLWETDNYYNFVVSDSKECEDEDRQAKRHQLFVVPEAQSGKYELGLELKIAPGQDPSRVRWSIADSNGSEVAVGSMQGGMPEPLEIPQGGSEVDCFPSDSGDHRCIPLTLRFGIDSNENNVLDYAEWVPNVATDPLTGLPVRPEIRALTIERYDQGFQNVNKYASLPVVVPFARTLLRIFRDGDQGKVDSQNQTDNLGPADLHYRDGDFSNWLTHKTGATFRRPTGVATIQRYIWPRRSPHSAKIAQSQEILCDMKRIYEGEEAETTIGEFFEQNSESTKEFVFSLPLPPSDQGPDEQCPGFIEFKAGTFFEGGRFRDLRIALGRARVSSHEIRVRADRTTNGFNIRSVTSIGEIEDLYDFSYVVPGLAPEAAAVQIGHSAISRLPGQIFLDAFQFGRTWTGTPPWGGCP